MCLEKDRKTLKISAMLPWCIVLLTLGITCNAAASPLAPKDISRDNVVLGNARVDAWRSFRMDLDTLNHGDVHPAMVHEWLNNSPLSVLRHIARHSMDPTLVLAAANTIVERKVFDTALYRELIQKWSHSSRLQWFEAIQVMGRDRETIVRLESNLGSRSDVIRVSAAAVLAIAGDTKGKRVLLHHVALCGSQVSRAAKVLANTGGTSERKAIEKSIASGCRSKALRRASGEILFRQLYPIYHDLLQRRDSSDTRYQAESGMYAAWFDIVRYAYGNGVKTVAALVSWLQRFRDFPLVWPDESPEVSRRNMDALVGFLSVASNRIRQKSTVAPWPVSWAEALKQMADESTEAFGERVSAAVAILNWTENIVPFNHEHSGIAYTILSPRSKRVSDGNWCSSWQGKKGDMLELEWFPVRDVRTLWVATGCMNDPNSVLKKIGIRVTGADEETDKIVSLNPSARFYQPILIERKSVRKIIIEIVATEGTAPVCINELRATTH